MISKEFVNTKLLKKISSYGLIPKLILTFIKSSKSFKLFESWHKVSSSHNTEMGPYISDILKQMNLAVKTVNINAPSSGPCIVVANHPTGMLEVLLWLQNLLKIRPDVKFLANYWFEVFPNAADYIISVNPFEEQDGRLQNKAGITRAIDWLNGGGVLVVFPAGEVASKYYKSKLIQEAPWRWGVISLAEKTQALIIPGYCQATNSNFFHRLGWMHPRLRTLRLLNEFSNKIGTTVELFMGNPIEYEKLQHFPDKLSKLSFLRLAVESLNQTSFYDHKIETATPVREAVRRECLISELSNIEAIDKIQHYEIYKIRTNDCPNVVEESGRLREISFRSQGEGTGNSVDIDKYDISYQQLIIWDTVEKRIIAGMRLGFGKEVLPDMYFLEAAKADSSFMKTLNHSIDFGRLFVVENAPTDINPLLILIRLVTSLLQKTDYKYLIGQVSIPSSYPQIFIDIILAYLYKNCYDPNMAAHLKEYNLYKPIPYLKDHIDSFLNNIKNTKELNSYLRLMDQGTFKLPNLIRFYLNCNAKIIGANFDQEFGSVDALMIIDREKLPKFFGGD